MTAEIATNAVPARSAQAKYRTSIVLRRACFTARPLLHGLDALDHVGVLGTVLVPHRLDRVLERFLIGDLGDRDACSLGLFHGSFFVFHPQLALLELCLAAEFLYQRLIGRQQSIPGLLRHDENL